MWSQVYDPLGNAALSTLLAALPVVVLLGTLGLLRLQAHIAALLGLATSLVIASVVFGMPASMALASAGYGMAYGLFPIGWIVLNVIFLYQLTNERGLFTMLRFNGIMTNPPLPITEEQLAEGFGIIDEALDIADKAIA